MNLSPHSMVRAAYEDTVAQMNSGLSYGGGGDTIITVTAATICNEMSDRVKNRGNEAERTMILSYSVLPTNIIMWILNMVKKCWGAVLKIFGLLITAPR